MSQQTQVVPTTPVQVETWRNPNQGRVVIRHLDHRGELAVEEMVGPGRTFVITPQERELNSRLAYSPETDMFRNGTLTPVQLIEGSDIAREVAQNPNLLSEGDMRGLVTPKARSKGGGEAFLAKLQTITNATTLTRLLQLAMEEDAPFSRAQAIQARLAEVEGIGTAAPGSIDGPGAGSEPERPGRARAVTPR